MHNITITYSITTGFNLNACLGKNSKNRGLRKDHVCRDVCGKASRNVEMSSMHEIFSDV